jgi:hypothetical protein
MPVYLMDIESWKLIWPVPVFVFLFTCLLMIFSTPLISKRDFFWSIYAFSLLGIVTGTLAGLSRQPVISAILPPVLSLVGGLAIYLIGKDKENRVLVGFCIIALSFNLLIGSVWGAKLRETSDAFKNSAEYLKAQALTEIEVREFREALGLPEKR